MAESGCAAQVASVQVPSEMGPVDLTGMAPILSDVRESLVLVHLTDGRSLLTCYFENGVAGLADFMENGTPRNHAPCPPTPFAERADPSPDAEWLSLTLSDGSVRRVPVPSSFASHPATVRMRARPPVDRDAICLAMGHQGLALESPPICRICLR